jgi:DnaJ-class molecular chaperone
MATVQTKDYYKILGVDRNADEKTIRNAFRKLARKYHPDVNKGDASAEERFKEVNEAKEVLLNAASRKLYDRYGDEWRQYRDAGFTGDEPRGATPRPGGRAAGGANPFEGFEHWTTTDGGGTTFTTTMGEEGGGFGDFFSSMFGGHAQRATNVKRRGEDLGVDVTVSFDEAYAGTTRRLDIQAPETCPTCQGTGMVRQAPCPTCDGTGVVARTKTIEVKIPAGVDTGSKIRIRGQGGPGHNGGAPGDVILKVTVAASPLFERDGRNLRTDVEVPLYTAVLGGEVVVPTPKGQVALTIPAESQNGRVFRLKGQGMPAAKGVKEPAGDLYVRAKVTIPTRLSDKERDLFKELRDIRT